MKFFYDTEFLEGPENITGINTIQLISIGIVAEDGRDFYAISKDFNILTAWRRNDGTPDKPNYWIRENVLKPVFDDLCKIQLAGDNTTYHFATEEFTDENLIWLIQQHGKSNYIIAKEIQAFIKPEVNGPVQLYGYYSAYDHVVFCWLFGKMMDLPKGIPKYTIDLKQSFDSKANEFKREDFFTAFDFANEQLPPLALEEKIKHLKMHVRYPVQENEHNALADARWNFELFKFLKTI